MTFEQDKYRNYLESSKWKQLRAKAIARDEGRCRVCNSGGNGLPLDVHHRVYGQWGDERVEDLTTLCHTCHELYENGRRFEKQQEKEIRSNAIDKMMEAMGLEPPTEEQRKELERQKSQQQFWNRLGKRKRRFK